MQLAGVALAAGLGCTGSPREDPSHAASSRAGASSIGGAAGTQGNAGSVAASGASSGRGPDTRDAGLMAGAGAATSSGADPGFDAASAAPSPCLDFAEPRAAGAIDLAELDQLSGLVASRQQPGVLFAHEDSTGSAVVYALDSSGRGLAAFTLVGAPSTDWEDIAAGPGPDGSNALFIGDIGDNAVRNGGAARDEIQVLRLAEPSVSIGQAFTEAELTSFEVLRFRYPSGMHEAETLLVDPRSGDLLIVTRAATGDSGVYRASGATAPDTLTELEELSHLTFAPSGQGALATAGDISPSGDRILIRTYTDVYLWALPAGRTLAEALAVAPHVMPWAVAPQGEGISFTADGRAWLGAGEQESTLYRADEACSR